MEQVVLQTLPSWHRHSGKAQLKSDAPIAKNCEGFESQQL